MQTKKYLRFFDSLTNNGEFGWAGAAVPTRLRMIRRRGSVQHKVGPASLGSIRQGQQVNLAKLLTNPPPQAVGV